MTRQAFTKRNLLRSQRGLAFSHSGPSLANAAHSASSEIEANNFSWPRPESLRVNGKTAYYFSSLKARLVANRLADNIRFAYRIQMPNRNLVIDQLATLLQENVPFTVMKFDVKGFFESIDRSRLFAQLDYDLKLTTESRTLLYDLCAHPDLPNSGIPRGLPVSGMLAELFIRPFDDAVRILPDVYFYTRFVDDILVFASSDASNVETRIEEASHYAAIPLNEDKKESQTVECTRKKGPTIPADSKCFPNCQCTKSDGNDCELSFLGYSFNFNSAPLYNAKSKDVPFKISLAKKKERKLQQRLFDSFGSFIKNQDFDLLRDRLRFLTGTYTIRKNTDGSRLKGGNYFAYPKLTQLEAFKKLDQTKSLILFGSSYRLSSALSSILAAREKRTLAKISFSKAYSARYHYNFDSKRVAEIRSCFES